MRDQGGGFTEDEIRRLREETAGLEADADGRVPLFLNNAGASLQPRVVVERVVEHLRLEERIGGYEAADQVLQEQATVYASVARLIGAETEEIALTESATRAWDMAFYALRFQPGDVIVTAQNEYSSNCVAFLQMARRTGAEIVVAPATGTGEIDLDALEGTLKKEKVKVVAITHIATNNGMVQPAAEVGRLTRACGVTYLLDACQSVGQRHVDVGAIGCDLLSATGRKFLRGPRGTGFLYVRKGILEELEPPFLDTHAADWSARDAYTMRPDARRFEAWESSAALALGLGVAAEYAMGVGLGRIEARVQSLAGLLRRGLAEIPGVKVTDTGTNQSGIVVFVHARVASAALVAALAKAGMVARVSPRFATRFDEGLSALEELTRASVHYFNTEDEVGRFCEAVAGMGKGR